MRALHHLAIQTNQIENLAEFYKNIFSLEELDRKFENGNLRSIWLNADGIIVMLEKLNPIQMRNGTINTIFLAFLCSPSDRKMIETELESRNILIEERTQYTSYFKDPDGNRIGISHYPEK